MKRGGTRRVFTVKSVRVASSDQRAPANAGSRARAPEEYRALLQRVVWSHQFEKSARLRELLFYVCERASQDPAVEIHEQEIGHAVFGRPADYDTSQDNLVRVTASQLRRKLEQYFASEGLSEPVILEIPKGRYTPVFRDREAPAEETAGTAAEPAEQPWPARRRRAVIALAACSPLLAIVAVWCAIALHNERSTPHSPLKAQPALNALWSQLLPAQGRTDVVVPDSSFSLFQELLDRQLTLSEYLNPEPWMTANRLALNPDLQAFARRAAQQRFTSMASVTLIFRIAQLAGDDPSRVSISSARDFNVHQMKADNVILLGSSRANPWVELIEDRLNFHFGFDQQLRFPYFENRDPRPGELKVYRGDAKATYCQIAFVPNLGGTGNILAISGTEVEGTEGGGEFVTSERAIEQLRPLVPTGQNGRMSYFEILLKSSRFAGTARVFTVAAFRRLRT